MFLLDGDKSRLESRIAHRPEASAGRACPLRVFYREPIEDPPIVTQILAHLGLPTELPALIPARSPPQPDGFDFT